MTARLVVLVSGGGTNLQAIMDACALPEGAPGYLDAEVVAVVANRAGAYGLERARMAGIPAIHVPVDGRRRAIYDGVLSHVVGEHEPTLVVMAGWMRLLGNRFLQRYRSVNLHPALPGQFPGLHAIERSYAALTAGEIDEGGVMVHWVPDEGVDDGPVIGTRVVPFEPGDSLETYEARVHHIEHELFVECIRIALDEVAKQERNTESTPTAGA